MKSNIVLIGLSGCGKTTLGAILSERLNLQFIDVDQEIELRTQQKISQLFEKGEKHFRDIETMVTQAVATEEHAVISTGGGVVLRQENMDALRQSSHIIFLNRSVEAITGDIDIESRPLLKDDVGKLNKLYAERIDLYKKYADIIIENDDTPEKVINHITASLPESLKKGKSNEN